MVSENVEKEQIEGLPEKEDNIFDTITIDNYRKNYDWFLNVILERDDHFRLYTYHGKVFYIKFLKYLGQAEVDKYFGRDQLGKEKKHVFIVDVYGNKRIFELNSENWEAISKKYSRPEDLVGKVLRFRAELIHLTETDKIGKKIEFTDPYIRYVSDEEYKFKWIPYLSPMDFVQGDKMIVKVEAIGSRDNYKRIHLIVSVYGDKYDLAFNEKVEKELKDKVGDLKNLVGKNLKLEVIKIYDYKSFVANVE